MSDSYEAAERLAAQFNDFRVVTPTLAHAQMLAKAVAGLLKERAETEQARALEKVTAIAMQEDVARMRAVLQEVNDFFGRPPDEFEGDEPEQAVALFAAVDAALKPLVVNLTPEQTAEFLSAQPGALELATEHQAEDSPS